MQSDFIENDPKLKETISVDQVIPSQDIGFSNFCSSDLWDNNKRYGSESEEEDEKERLAEDDADAQQNGIRKGADFQDNIFPLSIHPASAIGKSTHPGSNMMSTSIDLVAILREKQEQTRRQLLNIQRGATLSLSSQPTVPSARLEVGYQRPVKSIFNEHAKSVSRRSHDNTSLTSSTLSLHSASSSTTRPSLASLRNAKIGSEQSGKVPTFPAKLHKILANTAFQDMATWLPHGRSWRIIKPKAFEEKVIPLYFRHARYASFMRQVNGWGFQRMTNGSDENSYFHELFLRDVPELSLKMRRSSRFGGNKSTVHSLDSRSTSFHDIDLMAPLKIDGVDVDPTVFAPNSQMKTELKIPIHHLSPTISTMKQLTSPEHKTFISRSSIANGEAPSRSANTAIAFTCRSVSEPQISGFDIEHGALGPVQSIKRIDRHGIPSSDVNVGRNDHICQLNDIRRLKQPGVPGLDPQLDIPITPNIPFMRGEGPNSMSQKQILQLQMGLRSMREVQPNSFPLSGMGGNSAILPTNMPQQATSYFGENQNSSYFRESHETLDDQSRLNAILSTSSFENHALAVAETERKSFSNNGEFMMQSSNQIVGDNSIANPKISIASTLKQPRGDSRRKTIHASAVDTSSFTVDENSWE